MADETKAETRSTRESAADRNARLATQGQDADTYEAQETAIRERDEARENGGYMDNAVDVRDPGPEAVSRAKERAGGGKVQEPIERSTELEALHDVNDPDATPHWVQRVPVAPGRKPV